MPRARWNLWRMLAPCGHHHLVRSVVLWCVLRGGQAFSHWLVLAGCLCPRGLPDGRTTRLARASQQSPFAHALGCWGHLSTEAANRYAIPRPFLGSFACPLSPLTCWPRASCLRHSALYPAYCPRSPSLLRRRPATPLRSKLGLPRPGPPVWPPCPALAQPPQQWLLSRRRS